MAKPVKKKSKAKTKEFINLNLNAFNFAIIGLGIAIIIVGYIFLSENSVDGFLPTVLAPIFLVLGYCVIIPIGIIITIKKKSEVSLPDETDKEEKVEEIKTDTTSNIQTY